MRRLMLIHGTGTGRPLALACFRDGRFQGYAVKLADGWGCVIAAGAGWARVKARSVDDAQIVLRAATHAGRFEAYREVEDLADGLTRLPADERPVPMPQQLASGLRLSAEAAKRRAV